jgi:Na+(H+)/acetate symporter ActP
VRESRLGLMFNAVCKIPMQFFILLLGALLFVFYQFERPPVFFNDVAWTAAVAQDARGDVRRIEQDFERQHLERQRSLKAWIDARHDGDVEAERAARGEVVRSNEAAAALRAEARKALPPRDAKVNDVDYVFIHFVLTELPHGLVGLLIAAFFAATFSSKAAELNALASTTTVDLYRHTVARGRSDRHYVIASKLFTVMWGGVALAFALFASLAENLIQAVNIVGSIFYGVVLGMFLVAFFLKGVRGTAVFWGAIVAQGLVFVLYYSLNISYLWYNFIGCAACVVLAASLQVILGPRKQEVEASVGV